VLGVVGPGTVALRRFICRLRSRVAMSRGGIGGSTGVMRSVPGPAGLAERRALTLLGRVVRSEGGAAGRRIRRGCGPARGRPGWREDTAVK